MAQITLTIPNDRVQDVLDTFGYQTEVTQEDGTKVANSETASQFIKRTIGTWVKTKVSNHLRDQAAKAIVVNEINIT